ncbi:uroporphyrinogen-III synthase [bacterium]|nr:uroporphyrinogen-III synthase [bacterium]
MAMLIEKFGGVATVAPSMQEVSLEEQPDVFEFADQLVAGNIDVTIFMTGVGTDSLFSALEKRLSKEELAEHLRKTFVAVRGPKPTASLAKRKIQPDLKAPEPNTWEDLAAEFSRQNFDFKSKIVAIQEYGTPSLYLYEWLDVQGASVLPVSIYRWELPDDIAPLQAAIKATINKEFDILMWTSAQQVVHVLEVAAQMGVQHDWLKAANQCCNASIGPTASQRLRERGIEPSMEPSHPKMAHLVREAIEFAEQRKE